MPTVIYHSSPLIYLRTKKAGSHSVKQCLRDYAEREQVTLLDVRSKVGDTVDDQPYISHMPASVLSQRIDVWDVATKFTFVRNPWECVVSYYNFLLFHGPKYGYHNPDNYDLRSLDGFVESLIDMTGTCNFNREVYTINDKIIADLYDVSHIQQFFIDNFGISKMYKKNKSPPIDIRVSSRLDKYIYEHYDEEIKLFNYEKPATLR